MLGTADSSDEDDDNEDDNHMKLDNSKPISGDDLGDSFTDDSIRKKKGWVDEIYEKEGRKIGDDAAASDDEESDDEHADDDESDDDDEDDDAEDDSNDFGDMSARDWEQSDDEVDAGDDEMEDEKEQEISGKAVKRDAQNLKKESNVKMQVKDGSVPFVIDAPNNLKDLSSLLDGRSETEIIEIISRIRTCNSIRLAAENRRKMQVRDSLAFDSLSTCDFHFRSDLSLMFTFLWQVFYGVLLQYFAVLATQSPVKFKIIDTLVKPLIEMSGETPYFAAICARERLIHTRTRLCEDIKVPGS